MSMITVLHTDDRLSPAVSLCDPNADGRWRETLRRNPSAHLAHAPEWARVVPEAYGHSACYLAVEEPEDRLAVLPAFLVRRPFLGTCLVSMPFLDGGGPCAGSPETSRALVEGLIARARAEGAATVEIRAAQPLPLDVPAATHKVNMCLALPGTTDALWGRLSPKVRNQVRKAERAGLSLLQGGADLLDDFYAVFSENMRDLGSPVHSGGFFRRMLETFGPAARVLLVRKEAATLGGLVALGFRERLYVPWASCLRRHAALCPNMLLYWGILERAIRDGFTRFDFGRSTRGSGTYQFKRQWGAEEVPLHWYRLRLDGASAGDHPDRPGGAMAARLWRRLPLGVSRVLGPLIRKYLTQ